MPIKFRCQHCRQFLGISREKSGAVVDCPTCGRTIRVPDLDGKVQPLPKPGLNAGDRHLADALGELAGLNQQAASLYAMRHQQSKMDKAPPKDLAGQAAAGPGGTLDEIPPVPVAPLAPIGQRNPQLRVVSIVPLEPAPPVELSPPPPTGVSPEAVPSVGRPSQAVSSDGAPPSADASPGEPRPRGNASTILPGSQWRQLMADVRNDDSFDEPSVTSEPSVGSEPVAARELSDPVAAGGLRAARSPDDAAVLEASLLALAPLDSNDLRGADAWRLIQRTPSVLFAIGMLLLLALAGGFWLGRATTVATVSSNAMTSDVADTDDATNSAGANDNDPAVRRAVSGRVTIRTRDGESKPDRGARVLIVPFEAPAGASAKPAAVIGLRAGDSDADRAAAIATLRAAGADFAIADAHGRFEVAVHSAGKFHLVVLSNALPRDDASDATGLADLLTAWIDRPEQFAGQVRCQLDELRISGTASVPWDVTFE